jgi:N6-L-threonylcarbamoyladenine synthase
MEPYILGIESSCDDTSAAVVQGERLLSNIVANQEIHTNFGGVVPEYASRAHQQNIIPVVDQALRQAKIRKNQLQAIAYTRGPGLLGSLMVGASFAKALALALDLPLLAVDHLDAHVLAHFIELPGQAVRKPSFPFLCLTVSGGHTLIIKVNGPLEHEVLGRTIDDAAGEAFDKAAKILGLPYPGGVLIDQYGKEGNADAFRFSLPVIPDLDFSFSGLKTSFLYLIRDQLRADKEFIQTNRNDLCASIQKAIVTILIRKLKVAVERTGITEIAFAGGVSANSALRTAAEEMAVESDCQVYFQRPEFCTDNAAMIAVAGLFHYRLGQLSGQHDAPYARSEKSGK